MDPAVAERDPAIESELNHAKVRTLGDVAAVVAAGGFRWNVRVAKFVLEQDDVGAFGAFVRGLGDGPLLALYRCVMLNEYHLEEKYERHVPALRSAVEARGLV